MTRNDFESRIRTEIRRCQEIARTRWPEHDFPFPTIKWNDRRTATTAGTAQGNTWTVKFAAQMLRANDTEIEETAAHEYGHLVDYRINGNQTPTRRKGRRMVRESHGPSWQNVMRAFGRSTARCHAMKPIARKTVKRYQYKCKCRTHALGPKRNKQINSGQRIWCRRCRTDLTPSSFVGIVVGNRQDGFKPISAKARKAESRKPKMPKAGTKMARAVELVRQYKFLPRKAAIKMLAFELDMSRAGAQTYYYNARKILA